jgi:CBS domain-containing protein
VRQFLTPDQEVPTLRNGDRLPEVIERLSKTPFHGLPVVDDRRRYLGIVSLEEVHLAAQSPHLHPWIVAADLMRSDITPLREDDPLDRALELFVESDRLALPIVDSSAEQRVIGIVRRADISSAYLRHVHGPNSLSVV